MHRFLFIISSCLLLLLLSACTGSKTAKKGGEVTEVSAISEYYLPSLINENADKQPSPSSYQASRRRVHDLLHTSLDIRFDWKKQYVLGKATLRLKPYFYDTDVLVLDAKGFDIHQIALVDGKNKIDLEYEYDGMQLKIDLARAYTRKESLSVFIDYTAKPEELLEKYPDQVTPDNRGVFFIDPLDEDPSKPTQLWTQGETEASSCWFPTLDSPNERTSQDISITVENKYVTLSNGKFVESVDNGNGTRTDRWMQEKGHAPYLFAMIVGDFAVVKDKWRDMEVNYYVEKEYEAYAKDIFGNTPEMMEYFSKLFDFDYPWDKYSQIVVRDFIAGAMENTGAVTLFEDLHMTKRELLDQNHEDIIAHELAHHWFGDLITCESWANLALNEAFATYSEYLWIAHKYGQEDADYHINKDLISYLGEANYKQEPIIRFFYKDRDDMFDRHTYQKGGRVLHMLRHYLGDDAFFTAIRNYVKAYQYKSAEIHDLRLAFEEVCGEDLNWFFNQWFMEKGHPELEIEYSYLPDTKDVQVSIKQMQVQSGKDLFRLPLTIDIYHSAKDIERKLVVVEDSVHVFTFKAEKEPKLINVDADKVLLGRKRDNKTTKNYLFQYRNAPLFLDRYEAIVNLYKLQKEANVSDALVEALQDSCWIIRREAISMISLNNTDNEQKILDLLSNLAKNDIKSQVRAMATTKLRGMRSSAFKPVFEECIKDQSFLVVNAALLGLYDVDKSAALEAAKNLEGEENQTLMNRIARIYADEGGLDQQHFFESLLGENKGFSEYALMEYYVRFMERLGDQAVTRGLPTLENIAIASDDRWLRLNATKSIGMLRDLYTDRKRKVGKSKTNSISELQNIELRIGEIESVLTKIKLSEMDESLIEYYEEM